MKKRITIFIMLILLLITSATIGAFLTDTDNIGDNFDVGFVDVDLNVFFEKGQTIKETNLEPELDGTHVKKGIVLVNITDTSSIQFIENLRVKFLVKSNVNTFFRFKLYESLVIKTTNTQGQITEYVIRAEFDYNMESDFYYHSDGYIYYKNPVVRNGDLSDLEIDFIKEYFPDQFFNVAPIGQELQITFDVEAVQAVGGPVANWNLPTPPWGGSWL